MPESIGIVKQNEAVPKAAKAKRIAIGSVAATRGTAINLPKKKKAATDNSPLEWYRLTEITMHVLNTVVTKNAKEQIAESRKANPDQEKIRELKSKIREVMDVINDAKNFDSTTRMRQLLEEYSK